MKKWWVGCSGFYYKHWREKFYPRGLPRRINITFSGISYPGLPHAVVRSVPMMYYRFHGVPQRHASAYTRKQLKEVTDEIKSFRGVQEVYLYFNNDIHAEAVFNAGEVQGMVKT